MKLYVFRAVLLPIIRSLFTVRSALICMSYRFENSFRAGPGWNCSSILVLLESCLQTYMTYVSVPNVQWINSWWWTEELNNAVPSWSCSKTVYKPVWHIPLLSVQWINSWWWREELSETCRISCQNKICEISVFSFFYYKEICYDHGPMNVKFEQIILSRWFTQVSHRKSELLFVF
jgi:hypothetical protein